MLSVNGETKTVMKGITHGACDYLLKPVRLEELRNIWQHVVRRKFSNRERANVDGYEECNRPSNADFDNVHGQICGSPDQSGRPSKKRKEYHSEEEDEGKESNSQENDDSSGPKKPRVVWSVELHRKFVAAVNQLGIDSKYHCHLAPAILFSTLLLLSVKFFTIWFILQSFPLMQKLCLKGYSSS